MGAFYFHHSVVAGTVTTTTWTKENSPYCVTGTITVPSGNTLTIEPGVDVLFDADVQFIVQGRLQAIGTETDSIRFIKGTAAEWGGIRVSGSDSSTIHYARISDGRTEGSYPLDRGGAIHVWAAGTRLELVHVTLSGNRAAFAGALAVSGGAFATVTACTVAHNDGGTGHGGGIAATGTGTTLTVDGTLVTENVAGWAGGVGIGAYASGTISGCTVTNNTATSDNGGGILVWDHATATITETSLQGNSAVYGGAFGVSGTSVATVTGCTVLENTAGQNGGAFDIYDATATVSHTVVANNTAAAGGAFRLAVSSSLIVDRCTVTGNTASSTGGAVWMENSTVTVRSAILWGDSPQEIYGSPVGPGTVTASYSDIQGGYAGTGIINTNPLFTNASQGDYTLTANSPCINAGDPASPLDPDGTRADMGAYFHQGLYGDVSRNGTVTSYDASLVLQSLVGLISEVPEFYADVTGNGFTSAYDAHLILKKAIDSTFVFPVEGGVLPRLAADVPRTLTWVSDEAGWALAVDDPTGIVAGEVTLILPGSSPATVRGGDLIESDQDGSTLRVAFVRVDSEEPLLLRLERTEPMHRAPLVTRIQLNEGSILVVGVLRPVEFALAQNVPNPFNPVTTIRFSVPEAGAVRLVIYATTGQIVRTLVEGTMSAGAYEVVWDGRDALSRPVASGVYVYRLTSEQGTLVRRMVLVK